MTNKKRECAFVHAWLVLFLSLVLHHSSQMTALGLGCIYLRDDLSIRCQNTSLQDIGESLHILTTVVNNKPAIIDIEDCGGTKELTPIFSRINASIETVRIRRSGIQALHMDTFVSIANTLRNLDLSHNSLKSVPEALRVLWSLENLYLQHNKIVFVRPGSVFNDLPNLRELNLASNYIGQAHDRTDDMTSQHGYQLKGTLSLEDFSLGRALRRLESLKLHGNRLVSVPIQLSNYSLPELRHMDLSENVISRIEELSSALLPKLQVLDLHSNRLQNIPFYSLPITLQYLDLSENPFNCDCGALWLFDWYSTNTTVIRLPSCHSPDSQRDIALQEVSWATMCPDDNSTFSFRYMARGFRDYDVIQLVSSATAVTLSWKVKVAKDDKGKQWTVVYRRADDSPYQMTLGSGPLRSSRIGSERSQEAVLTERISNLQPSTLYIFCVAIIQDSKYTVEPNKCQRVTTKSFSDVGEFERQDFLTSSSLLTGKNIKTMLEDITVSAESIIIKWKLLLLVPVPVSTNDEGHSVRHEWTIRIKRTGSDKYTEIPVFDITKESETNEQLYEYGIADLSPHTHYDVCLVDVDHHPLAEKFSALIPKSIQRQGDDNEQVMCRTVLTSSHYALSETEIIAISLACALCLIVIAITIFLCRVKGLIHCKPQKWRDWFVKTMRKERPAPIGCNKYPSATIPRVRCEPRSHRITDRRMMGTWSSGNMPYRDFSQPTFTESNEPVSASYKDALSSVTIYKSGYSEC